MQGTLIGKLFSEEQFKPWRKRWGRAHQNSLPLLALHAHEGA